VQVYAPRAPISGTTPALCLNPQRSVVGWNGHSGEKGPFIRLHSFQNSIYINVSSLPKQGGSIETMPAIIGSDDGQDIAEYAVMLAVILVLVVGDVTGKICTKWNEREPTWRKSWSCPSRGTSQSKS
jgi:hypothetical protein